MGYRMYDFTCLNGHTYEALVETDTRTDDCPQCGLRATRIISAVRCKLDPISGDFPGATMKWAREHERAGGTSRDE
jgi:hypothetical protein